MTRNHISAGVSFLLLLFPMFKAAAALNADTLAASPLAPALASDAARLLPEPDSLVIDSKVPYQWKTLLKTRRLNVNDTSVQYPRFIGFCLDVYRWAERNFNTYDPQYVAPTGEHGKVRLLSDTWDDSYIFHLDQTPPIWLLSTPYSNIGVSVNYSILSIGYTLDLNSVVTGEKSTHKKLNFGISCARLLIDGYYWQNDGSSVLRRIGDEKSAKRYHVDFDGIDFRALGMSMLYVFNYRKFSFPAAFSLSRYQLKSAGSWMAGASGTFYNCYFDFTKLPGSVLEETNFPTERFRLHYNSVNLMGGYSYNWVINKHFLYNITALPGFGITFSFANSSPGRQDLVSLMGKGMTSLSYFNRQFFMTASISCLGNLFLTDDVHFMSGIANFQFSTGIRF